MLFALGAAASWAFYILASARVGREFPKLDGLALAMTVGALHRAAVRDRGCRVPPCCGPSILALGAAVAVLSSTIPYAFELIALRRLPAAAFAILMSLAPATAALAGFVLLGQELTWLELVGIALVIAASIGAVRSSNRAAHDPLPSPDSSRGRLRGSQRQVLVHERDRHPALADAGRHALDRAGAHIARGEDPGAVVSSANGSRDGVHAPDRRGLRTGEHVAVRVARDARPAARRSRHPPRS